MNNQNNSKRVFVRDGYQPRSSLTEGYQPASSQAANKAKLNPPKKSGFQHKK